MVTIEQLAEPPDLTGWQEQALELMRQGLRELQLVDQEETELAGYPARRLLAHHRSESPGLVAAVVMEQWAVVVGSLGYTLTASMATLEYPELADVFAEMVGQFRPDPSFAP